MIWGELRARGRAGAARVLGEVRRRFPDMLYTQPAREWARPPPRATVPPERADGRAVGWRDACDETLSSVSGARVVALHLSLTAEDWRHVAGARPQFEGHAQPRLPADLGFYDAATPAILRAQIALAAAHGVSAFAFVVGDAPSAALELLRADPSLAFPFCVAWEGDGDAALPTLAGALRDPRCLRHDGRPLAIVRSEAQAARLRAAAVANGVGEIFVVGRGAVLGCDASLAEAPRGASVAARQALLNPTFRGEVTTRRPSCTHDAGWPLVSLARDDEPLRPGRGAVELHDSPRAYRDRLATALRTDAPLVFVDAWNRWTEGAVLEPDARLGHAYLRATRDALHPPPRARRPVVVVHAYYVELLDEIAHALRAAALDARVIVTTTFEREAEVRDRLASLGLVAEVEAHENRGRDILPFLRVANRLLDEGTELVLKLHTKSSGHRVDGARWRAELIGRLLDPARVGRILDGFTADPRLGCVVAEGHYLPLSRFWEWNEENVRQLCVRMGIADPDEARDRFCAGSMFWVRLAALRPLLDVHLGEWEFPAEGGYVDGTIAHAIERVLGLAVRSAGFETRTAATVCGLPFDEGTNYRYAWHKGPLGRLRG